MIYKDGRRYYKNGGLIRRMKDASGGPIHYSRTMTTDNLSKAANYVGEYILKGLGAFGKIMTAPLTGGPLGPATVVLPKTKELLDAERKLRETQELLIGRASTWLSPLNYGAALMTGNGLNAKKGEEEVASWSPAWQAVGRLGELYVGPKAVKGASRVAINTAAKAGSKSAKAAVIAREINKGVNENTPKYDNRIHSVRFGNLIYDYSSNALLEFVNTIKTSPTNSYFMRAPSKIDITKLRNGRFRYEVVGDKVLPSGEVNGKFVSYGEPWKEFGFNEESALYEFPVGPKRGPNMMATDWKGRNKDYSVNEAYDYMKLEELLREDLRLLNEQMGKLFDKNYAAIRNNLIETKYPLLKEHIDTSIYGGNQTVIPSLKWNFDNFLNSPFYKYTIDPISNQVQKELVISGVSNKSVEPPTSLAFFERKPSKLTEAEKKGIPKGERNLPKPSFRSELNWSSKDWFEKTAGRKYKDGSLTQYTDEDIKELNSHIPEYLEIEARSKKNGTWLKMEDGSNWYGDSRSWVLMLSKNLKLHNPEDFWTGVHNSENFLETNSINPEYNGKIWGVYGQKLLSAAKARTYAPNDNLVFHMVSSKKTPTVIYDALGRPWYDIGGLKVGDQYIAGRTTDEIIDDNFSKGIGRVKINDVSDTGPNKIKTNSKYSTGDFMLDWETFNSPGVHQNDIILSPESFRKSLIGNNGAFSYKSKNIYRGLIPLITGYTLYNLFNLPLQQLQYLKQGGKVNAIELFKKQ